MVKVFQHWYRVANLNTVVIYHDILTLENPGTAVIFHGIFVKSAPGPNVIKLSTAVIYSHSMVILSFCVIKLHY